MKNRNERGGEMGMVKKRVPKRRLRHKKGTAVTGKGFEFQYDLYIEGDWEKINEQGEMAWVDHRQYVSRSGERAHSLSQLKKMIDEA